MPQASNLSFFTGRPQHPAMPTQKIYFRPDENPMNKEEQENEGTDADYELLRPE